jgi:hypothetical protein
VYSPKQELSLDEAMIPLQIHLTIGAYNRGKITKYGMLARMVCETVYGYICTIEIYAGEGKKLDTVLSLLDTNFCQNHHSYHDSFYNSVRLDVTMLNRR